MTVPPPDSIRSTDERPLISIVVPFHNEENVVASMLEALTTVTVTSSYLFEIVAVDDGSGDGTGALLDARARANPALVVVHLSRRFGKEAAVLAGLETARGQAVILIDGDLQHPPALIPQLLVKWREGTDVVHAVKRQRGQESLGYQLGSRLFYRIIDRAVGSSLRDTSDYKLLDRQVVEALLACRERARFLRGLVAWVGFSTASVPFDVDLRHAGRSKWSLVQLSRYALEALLAFTSLPLRLIAWTGFITVFIGLLLAVQTLYNFFSGNAVSGFTTVILLQILLCGLILVSLGVMSFYQAQMYEEIKARPVYIVRRAPRQDAAPLSATTSPASAASGHSGPTPDAPR